MARSEKRLILLAGGGTGGHIFPNMAVLESALRQAESFDVEVEAHFLVSDRPLDQRIVRDADYRCTALNATGLSLRPIRLARFATGYLRSRQSVLKLIRQYRSEDAQRRIVMVASGGFVCGPSVDAARALRVPTAMVNLDVVAGKANRLLAARVDRVFSC